MRLLLIVSCYLVLSSCALERDVLPPTAGPLDSTSRVSVGLSTRKVKFVGPVTIQLGGTGNTATSTTIAKAKAPVAAAPHAAATATKTAASWWGYAGLGVLAALGGWMLRGKVKIPLPF